MSNNNFTTDLVAQLIQIQTSALQKQIAELKLKITLSSNNEQEFKITKINDNSLR